MYKGNAADETSSVSVDTLAASNISEHGQLPFNRPNASRSTEDIQIDDLRRFTENDFNESIFIGNGGYGRVHRRRVKKPHSSLNMYVAEKEILNNGHLEKDRARELLAEANMLRSINHRYIVKLLGVKCYENHFSLIMEYFQHGSCHDFFQNHRLQSIAPSNDKLALKFRISMQVADAMNYLHSTPFEGADRPMKLLHLDLKSRNVLLDDYLNVKLCDFGLSQLTTLSRLTQQAALTGSRNGRSPGGTISHIAPEHLKNPNQPPTVKSDVYSYGIFLWELITEKEPYQHAQHHDLIKGQIINGSRPDEKFIDYIELPRPMIECMKKSWNDDMNRRPKFKEILTILCTEPPQYTEETMNEAAKQILCLLGFTPNLTQSDSCILDRTATHGYKTGTTTKSENNSTFPRVRMPDYRRLIQSQDETFPKLPVPAHNQNASPSISNSTTRPRSTTDSTQPWTSEYCGSTEPLVPGGSMENSSVSVVIKKKCCTRSCCIGCSIFVTFAIAILAVVLPLCFTNTLLCFAKPDCSPLSAGQHQKISCTNHLTMTTYPPGTKCDITCAEGYGIRSGEASLICQQSGTWSSPQPQCSKLGICPNLPQPANHGNFKCSNGFYEMSVCQFSCPPGFNLRNPTSTVKSLNSSCVAYAGGGVKWSSPVPYCERVVVCATLPPTTGGEFHCAGSTAEEHTNGTTCQIKCDDPHYGVKGPSSIFCGNDGSWNTTKKIVCQMQCPAIDAVDPVSYTCKNGRFVTSVCTFSCPSYFIMLGSLRTSCLENGQWTFPAAKCVCPACMTGPYCNQSNSWPDVVAKMNTSLNPPRDFTYGKHKIHCQGMTKRLDYSQAAEYEGPQVGQDRRHGTLPTDNGRFGSDPTSWSCVCRGIPNNKMKQCNGYGDVQTACKNALATFIFLMAYDGEYPLPCDAQLMPRPCVV